MSIPRNVSETTRLYGYGFQTLWMATGGGILFAVCVFLFLSIPPVFAVVWLLTGTIFPPGSELPELAFVWILSAPAGVSMLAVAHSFSPILISDEYLAVYFFFSPLRVPWKDVLELRPMGLLYNRGTLVRVSRSSLPWFYALYGAALWQRGGRYIPISSSIEDYQELIKEIKSRSRLIVS